MLNEFKQFALRGNVVDLAIGVIIGAAFGRIVDSLVGDIFMPVIGAITGGLDFSNYFTPLSDGVTAQALDQAKAQGAVLAWGNFITISINFLIIAWILFLVVKGMNRLRRTEDAKTGTAGNAPEIPADVKLLSEIRDLLKDRRTA
jgi:large conductance mechanosensitive channel